MITQKIWQALLQLLAKFNYSKKCYFRNARVTGIAKFFVQRKLFLAEQYTHALHKHYAYLYDSLEVV